MNTAHFVLLVTLATTSVSGDITVDSHADSIFPFEDVPAKLESLRPLTEADEDRAIAAAQVAVGRIHFQREEIPQALQCFQRAFRYDANSISALTEIVPLQLALNRHDEAARYAVIGAHQQSTDVDIMRRLALFLTENLDFHGALKLYQKSIDLDLDVDSDLNAASLVEMGRLYYLTQQFEQAAKVFDIVLPALKRPDKYGIDTKTHREILGRSDLTYALIGETYLEIGRVKDAAEMFHQSNESQNDLPRLAYRMARVDAKAERPEAALQQLQIYFDAKSDSEGSRPYQLLQEILANLETDPQIFKERLLEQLRILRSNDPSNRELAFFFADRLHHATHDDEAFDIYQTTLKAGADIRGYLGLVDILREREQAEPLLDVLGELTSQLGTLDALGNQTKQIIDNKPFLEKIFQIGLNDTKVKTMDPSASVQLACGLLAIQAERNEIADNLFEKAVSATGEKKAEITLVWILELFSAGRYDQAANLLQKSIDDGSVGTTNPYVFFLLAGAFEMAGQTEQALGASRKAVEMQPDAPQWRSREAWILYHAKRYDEAYSKYKSLTKDFDEDHSSTQQRDILRDARFVLSNIAVIQEDFEAAEEWLEQVLDEFPGDIGALNDLGYLYADREKHLQRSLRMVRQAMNAEPDNIAYQDSFGWALYKLGRYDEALEYLENASQHENTDGVILDHLGDVYWRLDRRTQAIDVWKRAEKVLKTSDSTNLRAKITSKIAQYEKVLTEGSAQESP